MMNAMQTHSRLNISMNSEDELSLLRPTLIPFHSSCLLEIERRRGQFDVEKYNTANHRQQLLQQKVDDQQNKQQQQNLNSTKMQEANNNKNKNNNKLFTSSLSSPTTGTGGGSTAAIRITTNDDDSGGKRTMTTTTTKTTINIVNNNNNKNNKNNNFVGGGGGGTTSFGETTTSTAVATPPPTTTTTTFSVQQRRHRRFSLVEALNNGTIEISQCSNFLVNTSPSHLQKSPSPPPLWDEMLLPASSSGHRHYNPSPKRQSPSNCGHADRRQSPVTRLRPGKFPVQQDDVDFCYSAGGLEAITRLNQRRSRSQPGIVLNQQRHARDFPSGTCCRTFVSPSVNTSTAISAQDADFIETDCAELSQTEDANATVWSASSASMIGGTSRVKIPSTVMAKGVESAAEISRSVVVIGGPNVECFRGKGSCCSQDSGVRSSTHSGGSLTTSSDETDSGSPDDHQQMPCCSKTTSTTSSNSNNNSNALPPPNLSVSNKRGNGGELFSAEAVFENVSMLRDELPFSPGDEVTVLDCPSAELWYGICGPRSGWFPAAYIRPKNKDLCKLCSSSVITSSGEGGDSNNTNIFPSTEMRLLRRRIVQELMSTERDYVRLLEHLVQGFLVQCRRRRELFPEERIHCIFGNLELILALHTCLFRELQSIFDKDEPERTSLANVFLRNSQQFGIYTDYCNNRALSCTELTQLGQQSQFYHFFEACRLLRGMHKLSLDAFLLTPVQRICRYPLQLLELLKATPAGHPDRLALELAQRTMRQIAAKVNDGKRRVDAIQKIWLWQQNVHGFRGPDLIETNHRLLINGELQCRALWCGQLHWSKTGLQVYLFDQTIVLCRRDVLRRSQLVFKERMGMQGATVHDLHDGKELATGATLKNAFKLSGPSREYIFSCQDVATKGLWLEAIRERPKPQPPSRAERRLAMLM